MPYLGLLAAVVLPSTANAQAFEHRRRAPTMDVLLEGRGTGGYGGPELGIGLIGGRLATRLAGRAGWVVKPNLVVGALGESHSSTTRLGAPVRIVDGGAFIEGVIAPYKAVHASIEGGLGVGSVAFDADSAVGVLPYAAIRLEANVVTWFRASLGPTVRGIFSSSVPESTSPLSGSFDLILKFGKF